MKNTILLWLILNLFAFSIVGAAHAYGILAPMFVHDDSFLTSIISVLLILTIAYSGVQSFKIDRHTTSDRLANKSSIWIRMHFAGYVQFTAHMSKLMMKLGLLGTIVGLVIIARQLPDLKNILTGADDTAKVTGQVIAALKHGMSTSYHATLFGLLAMIWLEGIIFIQKAILNQKFLAWRDANKDA